MVSVIILDNGEPNVVQLTFENLYKELKDIYGSELLIRDKWFDLEDIKNRYVCFVEADCLVSPGYFKSQLEGFTKKGFSRNMGIMASATAVNYWDNQIYGYSIGEGIQRIIPSRNKKSSNSFTTQIAYIPGAIMRMTMLKACLKDLDVKDIQGDLVYLSMILSMTFWERSALSSGKGYRVCLNPKVSYLTTEDYVNDMGNFSIFVSPEVTNLFKRESI